MTRPAVGLGHHLGAGVSGPDPYRFVYRGDCRPRDIGIALGPAGTSRCERTAPGRRSPAPPPSICRAAGRMSWQRSPPCDHLCRRAQANLPHRTIRIVSPDLDVVPVPDVHRDPETAIGSWPVVHPGLVDLLGHQSWHHLDDVCLATRNWRIMASRGQAATITTPPSV